MRLWGFESRNNQNNLNLLRFLKILNILSLPNNPNIQNPPNLLINLTIESESDYENKKGGYMICDPDFLRGIFQIIVKGFGKRTIR